MKLHSINDTGAAFPINLQNNKPNYNSLLDITLFYCLKRATCFGLFHKSVMRRKHRSIREYTETYKLKRTEIFFLQLFV